MFDGDAEGALFSEVSTPDGEIPQCTMAYHIKRRKLLSP
jgi:hypothetical protein